MSLVRLPLQPYALEMCHHHLVKMLPGLFCFHDSLYTVFENCRDQHRRNYLNPSLLYVWTVDPFRIGGDKPFAGCPFRWLACVHGFRKAEFTGAKGKLDNIERSHILVRKCVWLRLKKKVKKIKKITETWRNLFHGKTIVLQKNWTET